MNNTIAIRKTYFDSLHLEFSYIIFLFLQPILIANPVVVLTYN